MANPTRNPRTPIVLTVAALLLAAIFAVVAFGQQSDTSDASASEADNPIVLRLGRTIERLDDFNARFEIAIRSLAANQGVQLDDQIRAQLATLKPQFLDQRATELVLLAEADRRGVEADSAEIDATVEQLRGNAGSEEAFGGLLEQAGFESEEQLRELVAETQRVDALIAEIESEVEFEEGELRTFYQGNRAEFEVPEQVCARHILLENIDDAEAALVDLGEGADFAELASERSTGPSAAQGGDLGCFTRERMVAPFAEAAFAAEVGEPVGPVETDFGQHVILVYDRTEAGALPFEEVRPQIEQQLTQQRVQQRVESLRRGSGVTTYPDRLEVPAAEDPSAPPAEEDGAADESPDGEATGEESTGEESTDDGTTDEDATEDGAPGDGATDDGSDDGSGSDTEDGTEEDRSGD